MGDSKYSHRAVSLMILVPMLLSGQRVKENQVPLKNWAAPLYWHPNQAEGSAGARAVPQSQSSQGALSTSALIFVAITPCRLVDTRGAAGGFNGIAPFSGPSIATGGTLTIPVQSAAEASANTTPAPCGVIPAVAQAYSLNLTVVPGGSPGTLAAHVNYVSLWPSGSPQPFVSTLDDPEGLILSNAAIVPAGTPTGGFNVYNAGPGTTDVVIDMNGYFLAATDLSDNTSLGSQALMSNTTGQANTAVGALSLINNTVGSNNTATGEGALAANGNGNRNTANGTGALQDNTSGSDNSAFGQGALVSNTTGFSNTAVGSNALVYNSSGTFNTAVGYAALYNNTASSNSAFGNSALSSNTTGQNNTALGAVTLSANILGNDNTAVGYKALQAATTFANTAVGSLAMLSDTTGDQNTAVGNDALNNNVSGNSNTAIGVAALLSNKADYNTAVGEGALEFNSLGAQNVAVGTGSAQSNITGQGNVAVGYNALNNANSLNNIAIGLSAGSSLTTGGNNIDIANTGAAAEHGIIRIGTLGVHTNAVIAGIYGAASTSGTEVFVNSAGLLGTTTSSRRFKEQITDMGDSSTNLFQLRPVNFFYKPEYDDGSHLLQYGLIAEEVAKVYPEMVVYDNDGQVLSVRYQLLAPMLLNEVQKQNAQITKQAEEFQGQKDENRKLEDRLAALEALMAAKPATSGGGDQ